MYNISNESDKCGPVVSSAQKCFMYNIFFIEIYFYK